MAQAGHSPKAALITGGAKRLGKAIALKLAQEGYDIALHFNQSEADAKSLATSIEGLGRNCVLVQGDLLNPDSYKHILGDAFTALPHTKVLVNNASFFAPMPYAETTQEALDAYLTLHVKAPFFLSQGFAKYTDTGHIVNMVDSYITKNSVNYFPYMLSKKALADFTKMAARTLGPGILVNAIAPGITELSDDLNLNFIAEKTANLPLQRIVSVAEITQTLSLILQSDALTGQIFYVDSGEQLL